MPIASSFHGNNYTVFKLGGKWVCIWYYVI